MKRRFLEVGIFLLLTAAIFGGLALYLHSPVHAQSIPWPKPPYPVTNVNFSSAATQTLVAAPSAGGLCVYSLSLTNAGASGVTLSIYADGGTTAIASTYIPASGGNAYWDLKDNPLNPWFITNAATGFAVKTSSAVQINGSVYAATCP